MTHSVNLWAVKTASRVRELIVERIRAAGPITFADYMELALYHPEYGYYARAARRSGRAGDFLTSVDVGPVFGELLAAQLADMWRVLASETFDLVEAGAGSGLLARDLLDAAAKRDETFYAAVRLHLAERSAQARAAQPETLGPHVRTLASTQDTLPPTITGAVLANELLDALPVHIVVMTRSGLREVYVAATDGRLVERLDAPSTAELEGYLDSMGARLQPGWRAEVSLAAGAWVRDAARRLQRGFLLLIDYGHEADELYSARHADGTLVSYRRHLAGAATAGAKRPGMAGVGPLANPGGCDLTAHVNLTAVRRAAEAAGLHTIGLLDQTYFLLALAAAEGLLTDTEGSREGLKRRLALKTLTWPGGLGSTHKVMIFGKDVAAPPLKGLAGKHRLT